MASELRRRDVLRASGGLALAGAAGCLDDVIGEAPEESNGSGEEGDDGDDPSPANDNDTGGTGEPADEGTNGTEGNGTDGNGINGSNGSEGSDDAETPGETDDGDPGGDNESGGMDESAEANDSDVTDEADEPDGTNETEESDDEREEGDGTETEGTETEADDSGGDETNESAGDGGTDEGGDGDEGTGEEGSEGDGGETPAEDPPEGFVTYANDELGYSIAHPEGWDVEESGEEVYVGDPGSRRELGVLTLDAAAFDSSEALAAEFLANLEADYEDVEVREEEDRSLGSGQDARLLDVAYGDPDGERGRRRSRLLFVTDPGTDAGYVAEVAAPAGAFDDAFVERADTMLESFRID